MLSRCFKPCTGIPLSLLLVVLFTGFVAVFVRLMRAVKEGSTVLEK